MKELSIEEKAKAYDKALANAKYYHSEIEGHVCCVLEDCFPVLKEDEDEKIREQILDYFVAKKVNESQPVLDSWIAWLEKQGSEPNWCHHKVDLSGCSEEYRKAYYDGWNNCNMQHSQCASEKNDVIKCIINGMKFFSEGDANATWGTTKWNMPVKHILEVLEGQVDKYSANKVEPKFKVGDWIVQENVGFYKVIEVCESWYEVLDNKDERYSIGFDKEYMCHLWTIQDAKDGDVLCSGQLIILFKEWEINTDCNFTIAHAGVDISGKLQITNRHWLVSNNSKPATKEQRDLLFAKIKDAGYEWNADKKELKKIMNKNPMLSDFFKAEYERGKADAQKHIEWNREDEKNLNAALGYIDDEYLRRWLKDVIHVQYDSKNIEWSEEDEAMYQGVIETEQYMLDVVYGRKTFAVGNVSIMESIMEECAKELAWLESLKEKVQPQSKQE